MGFDIVRPDTAVLPLSHGKTITVRRRLNAGEERRLYQRTKASSGGTWDSLEYAFQMVVAYLLDWHDPNSPSESIREVDVDTLSRIIDSRDPDDFLEIKFAIEAHRAAMVKEREDEKKTAATTLNGGPISHSPSAVTGALSGSAP
jgi:hypothetical protein